MRRAAALAGVGAVLLAGCGGGPGSGNAARVLTTPAGRTITVPNTPAAITLPDGGTISVAQLTPFRDCVRDHGVTPYPFGRRPGASPFPGRAEMRARLACADKLPPRVQRLYRRVRRRFEQRIHCLRTRPHPQPGGCMRPGA